MPVFEVKCEKCGKQYEVFVKNAEDKPVCKYCGSELKRVYNGKMYGATGTKCGGCTGDCKHCSGCR